MMEIKKSFQAAMIAFGIFTFACQQSEGCTRALFTGSDNVVITARSMDWIEDMHSDLWIFPRGMQRDGAAGPKSIAWKSKYGSLIVAGYNVGTADGINEKGLVTNLLYLAESNYGEPKDKPLLSISLWAQYVLDNFANVAEAVDTLRKEPFGIIAPLLPNGSPAQLHLSISDASGDSAIFEYIDGALVIHHGKQYTVMTNSPIFEKQLALEAYWQSIGGIAFLPGTIRPADRFARASYFLTAIPKTISESYITSVPKQDYINQALASMTGVISAVSVPLGIATHNEPNVSSTLWRTITDHKNLVYYFDSATSPNTFWVDLADLDFHEGAQVKKLKAMGGNVYSGNVAEKFEVAKPFDFLPAKAT